jgi:hypothetical protein
MSEQERWQARIDADFPDGLVMVWEGDDNSATYLVPYVKVLRMVGTFDPWVSFSTHTGIKGFDLQIVAYDVVQEKDPRIVRVRFENVTQIALWSTNMSPELRAEMRAARQELLEDPPW